MNWRRKKKQFSLVSWKAAYICEESKDRKTIFTAGTAVKETLFLALFSTAEQSWRPTSKCQRLVTMFISQNLFNLWKGFAVACPQQLFMCTQCTVFISIVRKGTPCFWHIFLTLNESFVSSSCCRLMALHAYSMVMEGCSIRKRVAGIEAEPRNLTPSSSSSSSSKLGSRRGSEK